MSKTRTLALEGPDMGDLQEVDFLTCGSCQKEFLLSNIVSFMQHKKLDCDDTNTADSADLYYRLICQIKECKEQFATAWALLQHVQTRHIPNIYTALQLYTPGIESIQVQTANRPVVTTSSGAFTSVQQPGVDVRSLCMLGLGDTFDDISTADLPEVPVSKRKEQDGNNYSNREVSIEGKEGATVSVTSTETQTDAMLICTDEKCNSENCDNQKCCDDQNCCITIMPGTHEKPKKCCSAVVPKKRKQHMESKHMPSGQLGVSTRSQKRRAAADQRRAADRQYSISSKNDTIYIDVTESNMEVSDDYQDTPGGSPMPVDSDEKFSRTVTVSSNSVMISASSGVQGNGTSEGACTGKGSMIIQPGSTVTIPPLTQPGYPAPSALLPVVAPGQIRPLTPRATNSTQNTTSISTFPYLIDTSLEMLPQLPAGQNHQENITSINFSAGNGEKLPKFFITSQPYTQTHSNSIQSDLGTNVTLMSPGSPHDSKATNEDMMEMGSGGKKRRYPTSRPFKCEQCGNSFNQRIHLKKHLSKHTGIKPYKCGQCDYSTVERSHLKVHIRIHTGEKPFKCTFCEYATAQNSTLKIHLKRHHSSKDMGCSICGKKFNQPIQLNNHRKEHGVETDAQSLSEVDEQTKYPDNSNDGNS